MKEYTGVIVGISVVIAGFTGFFSWIGHMANALNAGETLIFVLMLIFSEFLIPFYGLIPFLKWFICLFIIGLPFYGLYRLFKS